MNITASYSADAASSTINQRIGNKYNSHEIIEQKESEKSQRDIMLNYTVKDEDIQYFRDSYDINNMNEAETQNFLSDLVNKGYLEQQDIWNYNCATIYDMKWHDNGTASWDPERSFILSTSLSLKDVFSLLSQEKDSPQFLKNFQESYSENILKSYYRIYNLLTQIF